MSDWTIETDEEHASGAINGRYQVCHPLDGLIDTADTRSEAFEIAERWDAREHGYHKCEVEVYDRMARHGQPRAWRRQSNTMTHCFERGDKLTMESHWKCIDKRGVQPRTTDLTSRLW